jgi:hypothetical protein
MFAFMAVVGLGIYIAIRQLAADAGTAIGNAVGGNIQGPTTIHGDMHGRRTLGTFRRI